MNDFETDDFDWDNVSFSDFEVSRNDRYSSAYGDYRGGYGPGGEFCSPRGPPPLMGNRRGPPGMRPMPPSAMPPPFILGRGFGPVPPPVIRPFDDRPIKYLMRCGLPKESLRGLPQDMLLMMEPQYCGLCQQGFDSFATSKIHYLSKNHAKIQKKALGGAGGPGPRGHGFGPGSRPHRSAQTPLKARELYCELCDVQITSKPHADSHYAGKAHRAVVEGRKVSKNPALLRRGMDHRVEQLIKRERKHLKLEAAATAAATAAKKPAPPELYCDICMTSVTCSEQMTIHLNGKKHLTKEKQHILKMMKGPDDEPETFLEPEAEGEGEGAAEVEGEAQAEQEDDAGEEVKEEFADDKDETSAYEMGANDYEL